MKTERKNLTGIAPHSLEILKVISRAPERLSEKGIDRIGSYLTSRLAPGGGFYNRAEEPDLYYSLFGLSCAFVLGLNLPLDNTRHWLTGIKADNLSLIDLSSLCKSLALLSMIEQHDFLTPAANEILNRLNHFRSDDGGYSYAGRTFPYAAFLAMNIFQDLQCPVPDPEPLLAAILRCRQTDGRFSNPESISSGLLLSTVAALMTLRQLTGNIDKTALNWVRNQFCSNGGFKADPNSELPDMLSTAVALFALKICDSDIDDLKPRSQQFVEDHWLENGSFSATLLDEIGDCEYCYYGLLALGALSDD